MMTVSADGYPIVSPTPRGNGRPTLPDVNEYLAATGEMLLCGPCARQRRWSGEALLLRKVCRYGTKCEMCHGARGKR